MPEFYYLTDTGYKRRERLQDEFETSNKMAPQDVRKLWVLTQYEQGKITSMTGPIMGPIMNELRLQGYIGTAQTETVARRLSGHSS